MEYYNLKPKISVVQYADLFYQLKALDEALMKKLGKEIRRTVC